MNIFLFTNFTPTRDNYRGPSAMMYHLFKNRPSSYNILIFSTNSNNVSIEKIKEINKELNTKIHILKDTLYNFLHRRETFQELRIRLGIDSSYNISNYKLSNQSLCTIEQFKPDIVWIYGEMHTKVIMQLSKYRLLVAGYDCFALHYNRLFKDAYCFINKDYYKKALIRYKIALKRELDLKAIPCTYYDVGIEDRNMFETITGRKDAKFYPHPHFSKYPKNINFEKEKLSILISGKLDEYTWSDAHKAIEAFIKNLQLITKYTIYILGKGWEKLASSLTDAGYEVHLKTWVNNYSEEISKYDIQIFPISVGSGTKGKVLDALCTGLLCIGSEIAMENIYTKRGKSCYIYREPQEIPTILDEIYLNKNTSHQMAELGRELVLKWHNPERILNNICNDILNIKTYDAIIEYQNVLENL